MGDGRVMAITHCSRGPLQTSAWCTSRRRAACSGTSDALGVDSGRCCRQRPVTPPPVSRYDDNLGFVQREVLPVIERERAAVVAAHGGQCPRCVQPWAAPRHRSSCEQARSGRATSTSLSRSPMERRHRALWRRRLDLGQSRPNSAGWASGSHRRAQRVAAAVPANRTRRRPKAVERGPESGSLVAGRTTCTSGGSRRGGTATSSSRRTSTSTQPRSLDAGGDAEGGPVTRLETARAFGRTPLCCSRLRGMHCKAPLSRPLNLLASGFQQARDAACGADAAAGRGGQARRISCHIPSHHLTQLLAEEDRPVAHPVTSHRIISRCCWPRRRCGCTPQACRRGDALVPTPVRGGARRGAAGAGGGCTRACGDASS